MVGKWRKMRTYVHWECQPNNTVRLNKQALNSVNISVHAENWLRATTTFFAQSEPITRLLKYETYFTRESSHRETA
jgi:hypothetical protein